MKNSSAFCLLPSFCLLTSLATWGNSGSQDARPHFPNPQNTAQARAGLWQARHQRDGEGQIDLVLTPVVSVT